MAKLTVKAGSTSRIEHVFILDSTSTTGAGKTGLTNASVTAFYFRPGDTSTASRSITLSSGTLGTFSSGGFKEVSATDLPGVYEFGVPNAVFAASANHGIVMIKGSGIAPVLLEYDLVSYDPLDTVRLGLTAIPNVASGSTGAIITSGTGTAQLNVTSGNVAGSVASVASGGIASTSFASGAITSTTFAANAITSTVLATDSITSTQISATGATEIASAVWDEAYASHTTAGTFGKLMDVIRKSIYITEATVSASGTPANSTTYFRSSLTSSVSGSFEGQVLLFTSGTLIGQSSIVNTFTQTNGVITLLDALTSTPSSADNFVLIGSSHIYQPHEIADGILRRKLDSSGDGNGTQEERTILTALQVLRNKSEISASTLNVYKENDSTLAWTATLASSAGVNPLTGIDPG